MNGYVGAPTMRSKAIVVLHILLLNQLAFSYGKWGIGRLVTHKFGASPQEFFEVSRPVEEQPPHHNPCSTLVLQHDFANTYGKPPVKVQYNPPKECSNGWGKVVLQWRATCSGEQYDRIAAVWLTGIEILRTSTAEPTETGIVWTVYKDITRYSSLLNKPQTLVVILENLVDDTFTGIYHVNITLHFYQRHQVVDGQISASFEPADLILPISQSSPENGGHWFRLQNASHVQSKPLDIPSNVYRAVLEIYASFHMDDEFWYTNPPNAYIEANNLTTRRGNGAFREIVALIDGVVVGSVWPFPVVFAGGINPLFWAPVVAIGAFDLPSYDLEVTPFVGQLLDGKSHSFSLGVTDALPAWFIDANLHVWLDGKMAQTQGKLVHYEVPIFQPSLVFDFEGLDGSFQTYAERKIAYSGWVKSTHGNLTTHVLQKFKYSNLIIFGNNGDTKRVRQLIQINKKVTVQMPLEIILSRKISSFYPLYVYSASLDRQNGTYLAITNISHALNEEVSDAFSNGTYFSSLKNSQDAQGSMLVKDHSVLGGTAGTQQTYEYHGIDGCYLRTLSVRDNKFLKDYSDNLCHNYS